MGGASCKLNHAIKQSYNVSEHYFIWVGRQDRALKGDEHFKSENLTDFTLQTSMNTFFGDQRFDSKKFVYNRVQSNRIMFFS